MKSLKNIIWFLRNKYVLTFIAFLVWIAFFDANSFINHHRLNKELAKVQKEKEFYIREIERDRQTAHDLMSEMENLERFAREQYLMKSDNEVVYLVIYETPKEREKRLAEVKRIKGSKP